MRTAWFVFNMKDIPFSGRNPAFQETLDVRPHLLILNKMDLADLSNKKVKSLAAIIIESHLIISILMLLTQNYVFTFALQRILKKLAKDGVRNVLFTDCLKQTDDNIRKVNLHQTLNICPQLIWNINYEHECVPVFFL